MTFLRYSGSVDSADVRSRGLGHRELVNMVLSSLPTFCGSIRSDPLSIKEIRLGDKILVCSNSWRYLISLIHLYRDYFLILASF
jgi:hypothetical protein